jgi:hypothetical protein
MKQKGEYGNSPKLSPKLKKTLSRKNVSNLPGVDIRLSNFNNVSVQK